MEGSPLKTLSQGLSRDLPWEPETYRRLFQEAPMGLYRVLEDGRIADANPALLSLLGCSSRADLPRLNWEEIYSNPMAWQQRAVKLKRTGVVHGLEFRMRRRDGSSTWVRETCRLRHTPDGTALYEGCLEDISSQIQTRHQLEQTHAELRLVLQSISCILIGIGPDERINRWNSEAEDVFGIAENDALGRQLSDLGILPEFQEFCRQAPDCQRTSCKYSLGTIPSEVPFQKPDGTEGIFGFTLSGLQGSRGCLILGRDITLKRQLENQAQQARKMEAIGQLAAGIAHEINTPTQYVGDNLHFLQEAFEDLLGAVGRLRGFLSRHSCLQEAPQEEVEQWKKELQEADFDYIQDEIPQAISQSLQGVERISHIVLAMRDFSHPGSSKQRAVDLNHTVEASLTVSRGLWKHVAEIETDLDPDLPSIPGLVGELNQVMLNLIVNAAQALEESAAHRDGKGLISIITRRRGEFAEIRIRDNGPGIADEVRHRIFDPFFTTKEVGKGTGQGLAISHKVVVKDHGGSLHFETKPGRGATFIVRLPLQAAADPGGLEE